MSLKSIKNQQGSASVLLLSIVPIFFLIFISFAFTSYLVQIKSRVRSTCVQQSISIQKNIINAEKALFALNPISSALRLRLAAGTAQVLAGQMQGLIIIKNARDEQAALDKLQQGIITSANAQIQISTQNLLLQLHNHFTEMGSFWKFYLAITNRIYVSRWPQVAVEPDFESLAPNYGLTKDYQQIQKLALSWQHRFRTNRAAQKLLDSENEFQFSCGAGPLKEGSKWSVEIKGDKF